MEAQAREGWVVTVMLGRFSDVCQQQAGVTHVLRTMSSLQESLGTPEDGEGSARASEGFMNATGCPMAHLALTGSCVSNEHP